MMVLLKKFSAVFPWLVVIFNVLANLDRAQTVNVSSRLVGPYNTGAGVNDV